jgi:3-hydroxyisobutyrate dehydrogenase-like beta-hydroxyacid dehydrogenase
LGNKISYVGDKEEARYLKISINMVLSTTAAIIGEALVLGKKGGIGWQTMIDQLNSSVVGSPLLGFKTQMLKTRDFAPAFTAEQMIKDLDIMLTAGRTTNTPLPIIALVRQLYGAMAATGKGQLDYFGILLLMEELAGLR